MKVLGIIPARYASTRFPGKPLAMINGQSMISRVYQQASKAELVSDVVVATDDERIVDHVKSFGGEVVMTSAEHPSGTDRCAEVLEKSSKKYDLVINIQGDEPYIHPEQIDLLIRSFAGSNAEIATLVKVIIDPSELDNVNIPKVVRQKSGNALYFSRRCIPFCKDADRAEWLHNGFFYKHIGIYGYLADVLPDLANLPPGDLEKCESLEQLRWLEHGYRIMTSITHHDNLAVDTPDDVVLLEQKFGLSD